MKKNISILAITLVGGLLTCQSAFAAGSNAAIGLGAGMVPDYEGSEDYMAVPLLYGRYTYGDGAYVMLRADELKWNFLNDKIEFGPLLKYRVERDDVDNNEVDKMDKVDAVIAGGFFLTGRVDSWSASLTFATDLSGDDTGYTVNIGGDYQAKISDKLKMTFGISTTYASDDYMETYFQIDNSNRGNTTLKNYKASDGEFKDVGLRLVTDYSFNSSWSIVGNFGYERLLNDAKDSPIVDDVGSANQYFIGAMGVYNF